MANALAIAAVTAVLKDLLNDSLLNAGVDALGQINVTSLPLDRLEEENGPVNRLNIYLWNVSRNAAYANARLPTRNAAGESIDSPLLPLDLHYVLTATGAEELNAEILLGYGMQALHELPPLTRREIRNALGGPAPPLDAALLPAPLRLLSASDLADQFEEIRISLASPAPSEQIETLSNLWSAFSTPLRASALYLASCVLIESARPRRKAQPVLTIGGRTAPRRAPRIENIAALPQGAGGKPDRTRPISPGGWIAVEGLALAAEILRIRIGEREATPDPAHIRDRRLALLLPEDLKAGIAHLRVDHLFRSEEGGLERLWESSNALPFAILPKIAEAATEKDEEAAAEGLFSGRVTARLAHPVGLSQKIRILLNPAPGESGTPVALRAKISAGAADQVEARIMSHPAGRYVLRVEIDGVASLPSTDPAGLQGFDGPIADLTP